MFNSFSPRMASMLSPICDREAWVSKRERQRGTIAMQIYSSTSSDRLSARVSSSMRKRKKPSGNKIKANTSEALLSAWKWPPFGSPALVQIDSPNASPAVRVFVTPIGANHFSFTKDFSLLAAAAANWLSAFEMINSRLFRFCCSSDDRN